MIIQCYYLHTVHIHPSVPHLVAFHGHSVHALQVLPRPLAPAVGRSRQSWLRLQDDATSNNLSSVFCRGKELEAVLVSCRMLLTRNRLHVNEKLVACSVALR